MTENQDPSTGVSVTRRTALRTIGSSIAITGIGGVVSASIGNREIVVSRHGNEVRDTELVPEDWYQHSQAARADLETAGKRLGPQSGVVNTMLVRSEKSYGGKPGMAIKFEIDANFDDILPSKVGTTPTVVEEVEEAALTACYYDEGFYDMPAGVAITNPNDNGSGSNLGTAGSRVLHNDNIRHVTAAHLFDACENDPTAYGDVEWLYHDGSSRGAVVEYDATHDWAVVNDFNSGGWYAGQIESGSGTVGGIKGHVTENGLSSLMTSQDAVVEKQGIMTGHQQYGTLDAIHTSTSASCTDMSGDGVRNSLEQTKGDSGGPVFRVNNGDLEVISLATMGYNNANYTHNCSDNDVYEQSEGYAAYAILNESSVQSFD